MSDATFVLGVDIDGVLADYTYAFGRAVAAERGLDADHLPTQTQWDFAEWGISSLEEYQELHRVAVLEHRIFRECPMIHGAAEALWSLSDAGVWIRLITHRLPQSWGHRIAVSDTVEWLDENGIPYRDLCFLGTKPEVEANAYIDDAPHNIASLRASGNEVIIFDQPYNSDIDGLRAHDWTEVVNIVAGLVSTAGQPFQPGFANLDDPDRRMKSNIERARRAEDTHADDL